MSLTPGTRLGIYQVTAKIGEGGMGEVYQARDTTLDRDVALKVLPEAFTADPDRLARFQREAKVLASLNHPNIGAIHGLESSEDTQALVLELIEGPTLADRIAEGPIPVDEALTIAKQMADALEAAHDQGIIHRDLKPANVKVRPDGTVKVLDFGLAKAATPEASGTSGSESPTMSLTAATQMGMVIGTAAYMSPEQAKGKVVDKRTDIWAFGAVLYEMLTGARAFPGDDVSDTFASVLAREPALDALPVSVPPGVRRLLTRCLEKDQQKRLRDLTEGFVQMEDVAARAEVKVDSAPPAPQVRVWQHPAAVLGIVMFVAGIVGASTWWWMRSEPGSIARTLLTPPPSVPLNFAVDVNVALTPDGTRVVYRGLFDGQPHLFVRSLDDFDATPLTGLSANPRNLFISPDGNRVGFFADGRALQRVSILGGPPVTIVDQTGGPPRGATWGPDDTIIFATAGADTGLLSVAVGGGEVEVLTTPDIERDERDHLWPEFLPGGQAVLFTIRTIGPLENAQIAVLSLESGEYNVLFPGGSNPRYVPTGHIVYGVGGTLRAVGFDLDSLTVTSEPIPVVENVFMGPRGAANFAVAQDGSLVYVRGSGGGAAGREFVWVDREGREESLAADPAGYGNLKLSPDGTQVATTVTSDEGTGDIFIYDIARNNFTQFTFDDQADCCPFWAPGGERVFFSSARNGTGNLYVKNADGTGDIERLTESNVPQRGFDWSADGEKFVLASAGDLHTWSFDSGVTTPLVESDFNERRPSISPDGRWVAYESDEDGDFDVYVRPFPEVDSGKWKVSPAGGTHPVWSPDGRELFYYSGNAVMAAPVTSERSFDAGNPEVLFEGSFAVFGASTMFDLSPDGSRFLMLKPYGAQTNDALAPLDLVAVFNWFEELKERVPVP